MNEAERRALHERVVPTTTDLLDAKRFLLSALAAGPREPGELADEWQAEHDGTAVAMSLAEGERPWTADPSHPALVARRRQLAYRRVKAELEATGHILTEDVYPSLASIKWQAGSTGSTAQFGHNVSPAPKRLRLNTFAVAVSAPQLTDPEMFLSGLEMLRLPEETKRCLVEGLAVFRAGNFLAAMVLLGAVSEGATYAAAQPLRGRDPKIKRAYADRSLQALNRSLRDHVESSAKVPGDRRTTAQRLYAFATQMIVIRNFGAHPATTSTAPVAHLFAEEGVAVTITGLHLHLATWAEVIGQLVPSRR